ncbi:hypothetical protein VNN41_03970 [Lactococcus garvieae]|uniref:hypothetical protein n=2 Tax=Lactococcus garvieae TaxID=1363 RepID=UPI0030D1AA17
MKKGIMKKIILFMLLSTTMLALSACSLNGTKEETSSNSPGVSSSSEIEPRVSMGDESTRNSAFNLVITTAQSQLPNLKEQFKEIYSDVQVAGKDDHIVVMTFTLKKQVNSNTFDGEALKETMKPVLKPMLQSLDSSGVKNPEVEVIFLNANLTVLADINLTKNDITE